MLDKKAQVGETMTWVIATIVIIVILVISLYVAGASDIAKKVLGLGREFEIKGHNDLLVTKSLTGYLLTNDGNGVVFEQIKDKKTYNSDPIKGGLEKSNVELANKIFPVLYKGKYSDRIFLGINSEWCGWDVVTMSSPGACDESNPSNKITDRKTLAIGYVKLFYDRIKLEDRGDEPDNTILELMLTKPTK